MLITSVMTLFCMAGIAFYLRFFVALCKECKPRRLRFSKYLRPFSGRYSAPILLSTGMNVAQEPATRLTKVNFDVLLREARKETL